MIGHGRAISICELEARVARLQTTTGPMPQKYAVLSPHTLREMWP